MASKQDSPQKDPKYDVSKLPDEQKKDAEAHNKAQVVRGEDDAAVGAKLKEAPKDQNLEKTPVPKVESQDRPGEEIVRAEPQGEENMFALDHTTLRLNESPNDKGPRESPVATAKKDPTPQDEASSAGELAVQDRPKYFDTAQEISKLVYDHCEKNNLSYAWGTAALDLAKRRFGNYWVSRKK